MESDEDAGMSIYAHVEALGLRWRSLRVEVSLRTLDGKPVRAAADAPKGYANEQGRFSMSSRVPVFDDRFEWPELRASVPHTEVLDLPSDGPHRLIATFRASCEGLSSLSEAEITVPPDADAGATRAVRIHAFDTYPNSLPEPDARESSAGKKAGSAASTENDRGLTVWGYVEAVGLDRSKMTGKLAFRLPTGKPLTYKDPESGVQKPLASQVELEVVSHQAQVFLHFIPYRAIGLSPGDHRLVLTYSASCDGLTAMTEEEHAIQVGGAEEDRAAGNDRRDQVNPRSFRG
jgi:hypothetical protein